MTTQEIKIKETITGSFDITKAEKTLAKELSSPPRLTHWAMFNIELYNMNPYIVIRRRMSLNSYYLNGLSSSSKQRLTDILNDEGLWDHNSEIHLESDESVWFEIWGNYFPK